MFRIMENIAVSQTFLLERLLHEGEVISININQITRKGELKC